MKKMIFLLLSSLLITVCHAQDVNVLLKEADNFDRQLKEPDAVEKYKAVLAIDAKNIKALVRLTEISCAIGGRVIDKKARKPFYDQAVVYAGQALAANENSAEANYAMALAASKELEVESENKKSAEDIRQWQQFSAKAIQIDPTYGKGNYLLGKWHLEMNNASWFKKAATKTLYGGMPAVSLDTAIVYLEKCRVQDPYFVANFLDLAKAYQAANRPPKSMEVLNKLVKLPTRLPDDVALKAEGKKMLEQQIQ
ncbi:MAG: hypothetical protein J0I41_15080 [Filimonas sp.]|nr:hypothetical protein [Filimonas sp.]